MRPSVFWDVTQQRLIVTDVSERFSPICKGRAVQFFLNCNFSICIVVIVCIVVIFSALVVLCVWALLIHYDYISSRTRGQGPEGPETGHLDTGFSWFPCVQEQMLRWFPRCQVATTCFSCSPPDLNLVVNPVYM